MKLTADNIKFIDSYLRNSGVKYIDIRMEMVDHIATALEGVDGMFYDNFKMYMAANKGQFKSTNRKFSNAALGTAIKTIGLEMLGPWFLVPLLLMLGGLYFAGPLNSDIVELAGIAYGSTFLIFVVYYLYARTAMKIVLSVADKIMLVGCLTVYVSERLLALKFVNNDVKMCGYALFTGFTVAVCTAFYKMTSKYKRDYV